MSFQFGIGDPAAMRQQAGALRAAAESIATLGQRMQAATNIEYESPSARRWRTAMGERSARAAQLAGNLRDLAAQLDQGAGQVEYEQAVLAQQAQQQQGRA